jgi:hypothetical protein
MFPTMRSYDTRVTSGIPIQGPCKNKFRILGARIWVSLVHSGGAKTGGIAGSFEDFGAPGADEDGLKPGCIEVELIFVRALN